MNYDDGHGDAQPDTARGAASPAIQSSREPLANHATISSELPVDLILDLEQVPNELGSANDLRAEVFAHCLGKSEATGQLNLDGDEQRALFGERRVRFGNLKVKRDRRALSRFDLARPYGGRQKGRIVPFFYTAPPRPPEGEPWDGRPRQSLSLGGSDAPTCG